MNVNGESKVSVKLRKELFKNLVQGFSKYSLWEIMLPPDTYLVSKVPKQNLSGYLYTYTINPSLWIQGIICRFDMFLANSNYYSKWIIAP